MNYKLNRKYWNLKKYNKVIIRMRLYFRITAVLFPNFDFNREFILEV